MPPILVAIRTIGPRLTCCRAHDILPPDEEPAADAARSQLIALIECAFGFRLLPHVPHLAIL
jgi:hypothetical protein